MNFESLTHNPELIFIREKSIQRVIGYLYYDRYLNAWLWISDATVSKPFSTLDEAKDDLLINYSKVRMDLMAKKAGTFNNEKYTLGR